MIYRVRLYQDYEIEVDEELAEELLDPEEFAIGEAFDRLDQDIDAGMDFDVDFVEICG